MSETIRVPDLVDRFRGCARHKQVSATSIRPGAVSCVRAPAGSVWSDIARAFRSYAEEGSGITGTTAIAGLSSTVAYRYLEVRRRFNGVECKPFRASVSITYCNVSCAQRTAFRRTE